MRLLTDEGFKTFKELVDTKPLIINAQGDYSPSSIWYSGIKEAIALTTEDGRRLVCTPSHVIMTLEGEKQAADCLGKKLKGYRKDSLVCNITLEGKVDCFDFSEPLTNWGVVEGFVVRNCTVKL